MRRGWRPWQRCAKPRPTKAKLSGSGTLTVLKDFQSAADEAARSRLYAGIHFGFGVTGGQAQGRCVAAKVLAQKYRR